MKEKKVKPPVDMSIPPIGKYGLLMGRNKYIKLDNVQSLIKSHRTFVLYKWTKEPIGVYKDLYAYLPWISYAAGKFTILSNHKWVKPTAAMKPMHIWFKSDQELKDWLGDAMFSMLVADLM